MIETRAAARPHLVAPQLDSCRVALIVHSYDSVPGTCDAGLSVTIKANSRTLRRAGVQCEDWSVPNVVELANKLEAENATARPVTHVILNTPSFVWPYPSKKTPGPESILELATRWPNTDFVQLNHSGMAYISIDLYGMKHIREALSLSLSAHNVHVAGNNPRFIKWVSDGLGGSAIFLPNLYDLNGISPPAGMRCTHDPLRIGSFGAGRPWKNQLSAAEAAVVIGRRLGVQHELYINSGRWFGDGSDMMEQSRRELYDGLPGAKLINVPWMAWPQFRSTVAGMDIMLSPSFSETFCVVVADGIAEGVPSVVTAAMEWAPKAWMADPDDPNDIAGVAMGLLHDRAGAAYDGRRALSTYVRDGLASWMAYLTQGAV